MIGYPHVGQADELRSPIAGQAQLNADMVEIDENRNETIYACNVYVRGSGPFMVFSDFRAENSAHVIGEREKCNDIVR